MARWCGLALVGLATLVFATSAAAKPVTVKFKEGSGDAPNPQLDLTSAELTYDSDNGALVGAIVLGAPPTIQVINSVEFYMGQFDEGNGRCYDTYTISTSIPDAEDVGAGLPFPYTELFKGGSSNAIGYLPSATNGSTITFNSVEANPEVAAALKSGRFACATVETSEANTFNVRDSSQQVSFLAGPQPRCRIARRSVQAGKSLPVRCTHVGKRVGVHLHKRGPNFFRGTERVRRGRFRVPTSKDMKGRWNITLWKGKFMIGRFLKVRVR